MRMKWLAGLLVASLSAGCIWLFRGPLGLSADSRAANWSGLATLRSLLGKPPAPEASSRPDEAGKPRKCLVRGEVLYTNSECPAGSRRQAITGSVSVLPAGPDAAPASAPQGPKHVRDLLVKPDEVNIKDKRMEEIIGK